MKARIVVAFVAAIAVALIVFAQTDQDEYYGVDRQITLRAASGDLTAGETATAVTNLQVFSEAIVFINITTATLADADDEVDFYLQTTYDEGTSWVDLANVHLANADNGSPQKTMISIGAIPAGVAQLDDPTDGAIADDTNADYPVGSQLRIKTTVTGATAPTYAYSALDSYKDMA
jgi:hypothetical protein